jgi:hypothetical protein
VQAQLPLVGAEGSMECDMLGPLQTAKGKDYEARFAVAARERGLNIAIPQKMERGLRQPHLSFQFAAAFAMAVLLLAAGLYFYRWKGATERQTRMPAEISMEMARLAGENSALRKQIESLREPKQSAEVGQIAPRSDSKEAEARVRELEAQLRRDALALENLQAQLRAANDSGVQADRKLQEAQQTLTAKNEEIDKLRPVAFRAQDADATLVAQQYQIADLTRRNKDLEELTEKQQKLLTVDEDVRNLMAARSLHITDVFDVDGKGTRKSAFGRVFYTEGKSLVFYAFDLDAPKVMNAKHSFQAWGQLSEATTSAVNLGIFYVDDPAQKRWMLRFDNPEVLKRLSAVFVTAEPHGGTARPTGQKLMYAYLGHEPNHP